MTVYLTPTEHEAMELLYGAFNMVSDTVTLTQSTLQMLQKSRKDIRDEINNRFDSLIEQICAKKMELIQAVSTKYQKKCKKLQTQLICFQKYRKTIAGKKREFETISIDRTLTQPQREHALIHLVNKQVSKLKKSLSSKKIITSSNMHIINTCQIPSVSATQSTLTTINGSDSMNLRHAIHQCTNLVSNTNIISTDNKREFGEMYGLNLKCLLLPENRAKTLSRADTCIKRKKTRSSSKTFSPSTARKSKSNPHIKRKRKSKPQYNLEDLDTVMEVDSTNYDNQANERRIIRRRSTGDKHSRLAGRAEQGHRMNMCRLRLIERHEHKKKANHGDHKHDCSSTDDSSQSSLSSTSVPIHLQCSEQRTKDAAAIKNNDHNKIIRNLKFASYKVEDQQHDTDVSSSILVEDAPHNQEEMDEEMLNDALKDMEEVQNDDQCGKPCCFHPKLKSFGIELTNGNKVVHKNHGNLNEDYVLLDAECTATVVRCWRFSSSASFVFWGVVYRNDQNNYDLKRVWGCCSENAYVSNGVYKYNEIQTEQWKNNLVDMLLDLKEGCLKFASPNFIESKLIFNDGERNKKWNEIVKIDGISKNKTWCPIVKLQHVNSMVMAREIDPKWFGKYPKAVKFDTFAHV